MQLERPDQERLEYAMGQGSVVYSFNGGDFCRLHAALLGSEKSKRNGPMNVDHDQIFKQLIEAFFREFMDLFCPNEATVIDFSCVEFLREEHFTDIKAGLHRRLDLVAKVGLMTGGEKFVLVHGEFEASRKQQDFPRRMFKYFCQLFLRYDTEIVPIAVFTDDTRWKPPCRTTSS